MINRVVLVGNLTRDPELKMTPSGVNVASFSIAVSRQYKNANGEREADFINCVAWRGLAETLTRYCKKGSQIAVEGRMQTRNYDAQDGSKRYVTEIVADNIQFLNTRNSSGNGGGQFDNLTPPPVNEPFGGNSMSTNSSQAQNTNTNANNNNNQFNSSSSFDLTDDDLPF